MGAWAGGALGILGVEVFAPLLVLCWLCCWPDDNSDSSSEKTQKPIISIESTSRRRSNELFGRRFGSSAVSLHLPSTSGHTKQQLSAHRSHEEIRGRRKSHLETSDQEARYHSAPSVIDEVLHRRDWERSSKDLYIPLKPDDEQKISNTSSDEDTSIEKKDDLPRTCKKHYTNIKSSKKTESSNKESINTDIKDQDATENASTSNFYIGDMSCQLSDRRSVDQYAVVDHNNIEKTNDVKSIVKAKETKQSLNECIRSKDRPKKVLVPVTEFQVSNDFDSEDVDDIFLDRSGAVHHSIESRSSLFGTHAIPFPPPSVEAVGYESDASYLDCQQVLPRLGVGEPAAAGWRSRHASVGDVLAQAPALRPHSAALSESDLDFDLEGCDEPPPAYHEVQLFASIDRKETAI